MSEVLMQLDGVAVARGGVTVLAGITCAVAAGEALILRGPNGVGKTTLLRAMAGLQPVVRGGIEGEAPAYAAHADGLKSTLSARENLTFWAALHGGGDVNAALAALDLGALATRPAGMLSAGQKRRLGLARLLVTGRRVWLLDEPTVSLDSASVSLFAGVIGRHLADGGAAVIATHTDLGLKGRDLDLSTFRAMDDADDAFGEAFL